ncbi:ATP-grasp domain-containing protein [Methylotenera sp. L2L1]|uniref:ATP-grasp domain-containing protein n=1 Tax=Methylotenera sp. L2L1 TaxID=1502770 RepID=UPI000A820EE5|nr:ATP-grasp domain-containing protein [Methylotenera sp. L2L1]
MAEAALIVKYDDLGFDAEDLLQTLHSLDNERLDSGALRLNQFAGFVYGSGFEAQPDLLKKVAALVPVIGNSSATLAATKDLSVFFATMQKLNIKHPETIEQLPADVDLSLYVHKFSGGSGGVHIKPAASIQNHWLEQHYFQRRLEGVPVSLLFIANGSDIEAVGFNEQWVCASAHMPFRYGGAASYAALSVNVQQQLLDAAKQLTVAFGLLGLNSLDAIVHQTSAGTEQASVLEINPRLSATVNLYSNDGVLFERHIQACVHGRLSDAHELQDDVAVSKAHAIVYADIDVTLNTEMVWPSWVTDTPIQLATPLKIVAGAPVCSVLAYADNAVAAKKEVLARVQQIKNLLQSTH